MGKKVIYLDHGATTKLDEKVLDAMMPYLTNQYGNASSIYTIGKQSKEAIENARTQVAQVLNCSPKEIYFTSGGTESDNLAIKGIAYANRRRGNHVITTKIEHPAVLNTCRKLEKEGFELTYLNVNEDGLIFLDELRKSIKDTTILISVMFANNEIGTIQDIEAIGKIAKEKEIYFHTDAVQAIGNIEIDVNKLNIDSLSLSGHKIYGPKGVGVLYVKNKVMFDAQVNGGHQEKGKRAGTENVAGIVGLGKAISIANGNMKRNNEQLIILRDRYIELVENEIPNIRLNGHRTQRLPGNVNISFENIDGNTMLAMLDMENIYASVGSACTSGDSEPSHVLLAIGLEKNKQYGTLRTTFGKENVIEDVEYVFKIIKRIVNDLRNTNE